MLFKIKKKKKNENITKKTRKIFFKKLNEDNKQLMKNK